MKNFNSMADDYHTSQSNLNGAPASGMESVGDQQSQQPQSQQQQQQMNRSGSSRHVLDEMTQDLNYLSRDAPLDGGESTFGAATSYSQLAGSQRGEESESFAHMGSDLHALNHNDQDDEIEEFRRRQQIVESPLPGSTHNELLLEQLSPDNVDIKRPMQQAGRELDFPLEVELTAKQQDHQQKLDQQYQEQQKQAPATEPSMPLKPFLVSFMVDARGGAMRGCRHSGVRVIIPPNSAQMPMRITCRYLRRERLVHPPPLMEGEACASKIMEVGPAGAKFLAPVLIEVPHFASLRGKEREIIILRSDSGEVWREHLMEADEKLIDSIISSAKNAVSVNQPQDSGDQQQQYLSDQENVALNATTGGLGSGSGVYTSTGVLSSATNLDEKKQRLTRIVTTDFPQYFAIISRIRQEVHTVGPDGTTVNSQVVPRVQAIFTEGALTKRIKIGLQGRDNKAQENGQLEESSLHSDNIRSSSPTTNQPDSIHTMNQHDQDRVSSPQSQATRPSSASAKRRSRFLACFGAGHGSVDLLNSGTDESSTGGDSPRQACKEKPVISRHILGDVVDSDGETRRSSASPSSLSLNDSTCLNETTTASIKKGVSQPLTRNKRHAISNAAELVPEDYYIEKEPPLILNVEPKTYGKRLASSSAQTDSKLNINGYLSTSTKKQSKSKSRGLLRGKRKNKTQMTIHCDVQPPAANVRSRSAQGDNQQATIDSSLDQSVTGEVNVENNNDRFNDDISIIQDVITSDDHKWRTCTIQTDSDSVTVNYVTIQSSADNNNIASNNATTAPGAIQDDGYVSGSGDINRQSSFGKGLFSLSAAFGGHDNKQQYKAPTITEQEKKAESKRARKQRAKSAKSKDKVIKEQKSVSDDEQQPQSISVSSAIKASESPEIESPTNEIKATLLDSNYPQQDTAHLDESTRSVSPSSKELKQRIKLEKREREKREKEEKRHQKELEEEAAKVEKLKKKQEKEAKKAEKLAQKLAKKSPPTSVPQTPQPDESLPTTAKTTSVKFANSLVESVPATEDISADDSSMQQEDRQLKQLDSLQQAIDSGNVNYEREKERLSQEDGHDMIRVSISEKFDSNEPSSEPQTTTIATDVPEKLISFSDSEDPSKSLELSQKTTDTREVVQPLKPILKQQSVSTSSAGEGEGEASAEIVISEDRKLASVASKLVSEATEEAVKVANEIKLMAEGEANEMHDDLTTTSNLSKKELEKLEKSEAKKEAKAKLEEGKRFAKEAKRLAKEAEVAKKAEEAAKKAEEIEAKKAAKKAKAEQERLEKEAKRKLKEEEKLAKRNKSKSKAVADKSREEISKSFEEPASESMSEPLSKRVNDSSANENASATVTEPVESEEPVMTENESQRETTLKKVVENVDSDKKVATEEISEVKLADEVEESSKSSDEKKEKKKKSKKEKKMKQIKDEPSESTEPLSSASKSSSFFGRLFKKQPTSTKGSDDRDKEAVAVSNDDSHSTNEERLKNKDEKPMILSEMYPSDPDDADSEMILEVNVPKNLIINQQQKADSSQASDLAASPTLATTIDDSSVATTEAGLPEQIRSQDESQVAVSEGDDQATLVNMSQMVTSEVGGDHDDDDATENVVSQANELTTQATVDDSMIDTSSPVSIKVTSEAGRVEEKIKRDESIDNVIVVQPDQLVTAEGGAKEIAEGDETKEVKEDNIKKGKKKDKQTKVKKSKAELKEEKDRKELEAKLEKEAKKRTKEEEKQRKKDEKEAKSKAKAEEKQAKMEAKKREEEEKERLRNEAKEAKRLEKLAKKQYKRDKGEPRDIPVETVVKESDEKFTSDDDEQQQRPDEVDTSNMTPVNTETEVQKIVEETVDEEGVVTRTTKTIETKYVTMQQEEVKSSEHREMPLEEYQRLKRSLTDEEEEGIITNLEPSQASSSKQVFDENNKPSTSRSVNIKVGPYEHAELDEICKTPSYFGPQFNELPQDLPEKKAMKKRIKLNNKLIKRAYKLAKSETKKAKKQAKVAESEIAICDEAAKEARKELKRALKEKKRATKVAKKEHKRMDKVDKKLAKQQKKIEKKQKKLDKRAESLARKEAKKREKLIQKEVKEAKVLERKASQKSVASGSKKSIKLEDIGEPVLKSSSRLSIGGVAEEGLAATEMVKEVLTTNGGNIEEAIPRTSDMTVINEFSRFSPDSQQDGDIQVEMSLDYKENHQPQNEPIEDAIIDHSPATTTITETPDGQINETNENGQSTGQKAAQQAETIINEGTHSDDEEIDVVNDLPDHFKKNRETELAD